MKWTSERLRRAVRLSRVRQYQLANLIGVDVSSLSAWLNRARPVRESDPRVIKLGALVGVPPTACFTATGPGGRRQTSRRRAGTEADAATGAEADAGAGAGAGGLRVTPTESP